MAGRKSHEPPCLALSHPLGFWRVARLADLRGVRRHELAGLGEGAVIHEFMPVAMKKRGKAGRHEPPKTQFDMFAARPSKKRKRAKEKEKV